MIHRIRSRGLLPVRALILRGERSKMLCLVEGELVSASLAHGLDYQANARLAFIAFHQQIVTPHSQLPLPITHQSVLIIQHYLALSPNLEEVFKSWSTAFDVSSSFGVY